MKALTAIALPLAALLSGSLAAHAQTEQPPAHHYHHHHHYTAAHHAAPAPAPAAERPGETVENAPPSATNQMFKPYPHPGEGDNDGLSRDPDDCMKGCIGGNPQ